MSTTDLILEIGTEELPSHDLDAALESLAFRKGSPIEALFLSNNIKYSKASAYATPRRLILHISDIPLCQDMLIEGPPVRIAYDEQNRPTKALEAFLKKNNAAISDIIKPAAAGSGDLRVSIKRQDISNAGILPSALAKIAGLMNFAKTMRWNGTGAAFSRPIRWIVALFGDKVLSFEYAGIKSSNATRGHRFLGRDFIKVKNPCHYFKTLKKNHVVWDNNERRKIILSFLEKKRWHPNDELLSEVVNLVEKPCFIEGSFDKKYLQIPREVLLAAMSKHQRIFCLEDKNSALASRFAGVLNGAKKNTKQIIKNFENVLEARLKDALFFYKSDTKKPLTEWAQGLDGIVFYKGLGTIHDKAQRIKKIALFISRNYYPGIDENDIAKAAPLLKADLLTSMVREFPSLQGIMGMYYAKDSGYPDAVSRAISEHYLPRFASDKLPSTDMGSLFSLADKFDNIVSYFSIGKSPKGNWDPYALRRQAIGIILILMETKKSLSLSGVIDFCLEQYAGSETKSKCRQAIQLFLKDRLVSILKAKGQYRHDLIESVMASGADDIYKTCLKLNELNSIINSPEFEQARVIVERTHNIVAAAGISLPEIDEKLFSQEQENKVFGGFNNTKDEFMALCKEGLFSKATDNIAAALSGDLGDYFDKVMVNVDDKRVRANRLALLSAINKLYTDNIANLSLIAVENKDNSRKGPAVKPRQGK
ncbi:MAG: glycine--tRNA ligase subunit beta [Candidatus Omnitrophica bacterium]|nr:glycine--tRNA ligase subunit beta [Candidatus Omnitrophota bacterium]